MTKNDIDTIIKVICPDDEDYNKPIISPAYLKKELEILALEQDPCIACMKAHYHKGYKDGMEALTFHEELCKEENEPSDEYKEINNVFEVVTRLVADVNDCKTGIGELKQLIAPVPRHDDGKVDCTKQRCIDCVNHGCCDYENEWKKQTVKRYSTDCVDRSEVYSIIERCMEKGDALESIEQMHGVFSKSVDSGWIDIHDEVPRGNGMDMVLTCSKAGYIDVHSIFYVTDTINENGITAWKPLPEPYFRGMNIEND